MTYLHKIDPVNHPAENCPLCNDPNHDSLHLFNCPDIRTTLTVWNLWTDPVGVAALLDVWGRSWAGPERGSEILCVLTHGMGSTPPPPRRDRWSTSHDGAAVTVHTIDTQYSSRQSMWLIKIFAKESSNYFDTCITKAEKNGYRCVKTTIRKLHKAKH